MGKLLQVRDTFDYSEHSRKAIEATALSGLYKAISGGKTCTSKDAEPIIDELLSLRDPGLKMSPFYVQFNPDPVPEKRASYLLCRLVEEVRSELQDLIPAMEFVPTHVGRIMLLLVGVAGAGTALHLDYTHAFDRAYELEYAGTEEGGRPADSAQVGLGGDLHEHCIGRPRGA
jgi:hypothetical protein